MLQFRKKAEEQETDDIDITDDVTESDFIPFACHYDAHTLLTKNGELLQVLKVTANAHGIDYESPELGAAYLRDAIRRAIVDYIDSDRYAFWFYTLRRREEIHLPGTYSEPFARDVHDSWQRKNRWKFRYHNEVYIAVMTQGQDAALLDRDNMKKGVLARLNRGYRESYLEETARALGAKVEAITAALAQGFDARRLTTAEQPMDAAAARHADGGLYSEPLEFFSKLVNLSQQPIAIDTADMSKLLNLHEVTFGYNAVESRGPEGKRRFAGMVTLKSYPELPAETLDKLLQLPLEMVISQSFNFVSRKTAARAFEGKIDLLRINQMMDLCRQAGLPDLPPEERCSPMAFGEEQTGILVIVDDYKSLDEAVSEVLSACESIGLVAVREDIKFEECFWAQLPGNFEFLRRKHVIESGRMGGLARLNRFPTGQIHGNAWGPAVTILRTSLKTPYFFNFHHGRNGHTAVIDYNTFADTVGATLINFLLAEARKFGGRLVYFDDAGICGPFIQRLQGRYFNVGGAGQAANAPPAVALNPFRLEDNPRNRSFLLAWLASMADAGEAEADRMRAAFKEVLDSLFAGPAEARSLRHFVAGLAAGEHGALASRLAPWHGDGVYAGYFDHAEDTLDFAPAITGYDLRQVTQDNQLAIPVFSYLLHRLVLALDGNPTIIVLGEAWGLLDNPFFLPRLQSLLDMLTQNNALALLTTRRIGAYADRPITAEIMRLTATHLYVPDDVPADLHPEALQLSEQDRITLLRMERQKGHFMIKRPGETISSELNLDEFMELKSILSGDIKSFITGGGKWQASAEEG